MIDHPYRSASSFQPSVISPDAFYFTSVKIVKVALYALAALCMVGIVATFTGHLIIPITLPCHPALPLIALAILCVALARWVKDYKDPRELQKMQIEARDLTYLQIAQIHGIESIILYKLLPQKIDKDDFCSFFEKLSIDSLALEEEDKEKLKILKTILNGTKSIQSRLGTSYEGVINIHENNFKSWVLNRS